MSKDRVSLDNNDFLWMYTVSSYWLPVLTVECGLWTSDLRVLHNITGKIKEDNYGAYFQLKLTRNCLKAS